MAVEAGGPGLLGHGRRSSRARWILSLLFWFFFLSLFMFWFLKWVVDLHFRGFHRSGPPSGLFLGSVPEKDDGLEPLEDGGRSGKG